MNVRLNIQIFTMEIRKVFAYRVDFWLSFIVGTLAQFTAAWFLWKSIFAYKGTATIGSYTFPSLMCYYLLAPIISRTVYSGNHGDIATEIYEGTLTRYLVYPLSFFRYKLIVHCASATVLLFQLLLVVVIITLFFPVFTANYNMSLLHLIQGIITIYFSTVLYFVFSAWLQLIAFWADQIWSLSAIVRFITGLLGGSLIPLSLFPETIQPTLKILPFSYFVHFPLQSLFGNMPLDLWLQGLLIMGCWGGIFVGIYRFVWHRGNLQYTGVGI